MKGYILFYILRFLCQESSISLGAVLVCVCAPKTSHRDFFKYNFSIFERHSSSLTGTKSVKNTRKLSFL